MRVLIVGAGILGATLAYRLARSGAHVTIIEATAPTAMASGRSFGWINASFFVDAPHHHFRAAAIAAHHRLEADLDAQLINWTGALWYEHQDDRFDTMAAALQDLGYPSQPLSKAQFAAREPHVTPPSRALHLPAEGSTDAASFTRTLLAAALSQGAQLLQGCRAIGLTETSGQITGIRSPEGNHRADHVILATGIATPALLRQIGLHLPMLSRPGLILRSRPLPKLLNHVLVSPTMEFRQDSDGRLHAPTSANHQADDTAAVATPISELADAALATLRSQIPEQDIEWEAITLAHRPIPADGLPVMGEVLPGLTVAVMHSGATLAALAAELVAASVLGQANGEIPAAYRTSRIVKRAPA